MMKTKLLLAFFVTGIVAIILIFLFVPTNKRSDSFIPKTPQWNLPEGAKARIGKGRILDVAYVPNGAQFVVASSTDIWFYDAKTLEVQAVLPGHTGFEFSMSFSPDRKTLATAGGKTIRLWDTETLEHKTTFIRDRYLIPTSVFEYVSFIGDGETLASIYSSRFDLWNIATNTHHSEFYIPGGLNTVFSRDGSVLANSRDKIVYLFHLVQDKKLQEFKGHTKSVGSIAFSPDGKTLASGSLDNTVILWDVDTGEHKKTLKGHKNSVECLAFSPDGKTLASGSDDHTVRLWDVATGKRKKTLKKHSHELRKVLFSPDGKTLLSYSRISIVHLWDASTGKLQRTLKDHINIANSMTLSPDGEMIATGGSDNIVRMWDASTGKHNLTLKGHKESVSSVSFSPDGLTLASGSRDKSIRLWDAKTGLHKKTLKGQSHGILKLLYSPDGSHIACRDDINFWMLDAATGRRKYQLSGHQPIYINRSFAFSPDGKLLAANGKKATIFMCDVATGQPKRTFKWHARYITFSPDGRYLASVGFMHNSIRLWDVDTGEEVKTLSVDGGKVGHSFLFLAPIAFTPDAKHMLVGCQDGSILLLDITIGEEREAIRAHGTAVREMAFSADGVTLVSMSVNGTVLIWDFAAMFELDISKD